MFGKQKYDVAVIGAGIAGAAAARELSKYELAVAVVEKEADVCFGVTKGTHAFVHCGLPGAGSPLKNRGELMGNLMMEQICRELDVPFKRIGKLLIAFSEADLQSLKRFELAAKRNGVLGVELITDRPRIREMEPNLADEVIGALFTPTTGTVSPWSLVFGLMENAVANNVDLFVDTAVNGIRITKENFVLETNKGEIEAAYVVNASGAYADKIAAMVGDRSFRIQGSRQQRVIFDKSCAGVVRHVIRRINGNAVGDFIGPTVYGDLIAGSKIDVTEDIRDTKTTREGLEDYVVPNYQKFVPGLAPANIIKPFAGFIPLAGNDYHIKPAVSARHFVHLVLGGSGLTAAVAMAQYLVEEVLPSTGLKLVNKQNFNPYRKDLPHLNEMSNEERAELVAKNPLYGHIVCRCENVSEGEIIDAIQRGATTRDGVKFRTRAGMGRCQGGFCGPRVIKILSRELGIPVTEVTRKGNGSEEVLYEIKELL
jgi:glycerol-3-phosphate dehydrogenase